MKQFTIKNLQEDAACKEGLVFVTPLVEKGEDVAVALRQYPGWMTWAIQKGYDCQSAWIDNVFTWCKNGYITATAGDMGAATAGDFGTATAGDFGTATAGNYGVATAGKNGIIQIKHWEKKADRNRIVVGYIGEDGLEPNTSYKLDREGKFIKA